MRRAVERCSECSASTQCANHHACAKDGDAALAAQIGALWARWVREQVDVRQPWPAFQGRARHIALRLVEALASSADRRAELARLAHWRAGLVWESLERPRLRDRPFEARNGGGAVVELPGALQVHFRPRRARTAALARATEARAHRRRG